jgi:hypothetical protein
MLTMAMTCTTPSVKVLRVATGLICAQQPLRAVLCAGMHACNTLDSHVYTVVFATDRGTHPALVVCADSTSTLGRMTCAISRVLGSIDEFLTRTGIRLLDVPCWTG